MFGKAGRAETATDPAPLEMFETTIQFKPREQWRAGMTPDKLVEELDRIVQRAGPLQHLGAADPQPHRHARHRHQEPGRHQGRRAGPRARSTASPREIERVVKDVPGVTSALAERLTGGRYIDVDDRPRRGRALRPEHRRRAGHRRRRRSAARTSARRSRACSASRSTCAIRASCAIRSSKLRELPIVTERGAQLTLGDVARHSHRRRPADAAQRERAPVRLGLRRHPRPRPALGGARHAARGRREGEAAARLFDLVVGAVRVSRARHGAAEGRGARSRC